MSATASSLQKQAANTATAPPPLVTHPSTIELLDDVVTSSIELPIYTTELLREVDEEQPKSPLHHINFFLASLLPLQPSITEFPAPKMIMNNNGRLSKIDLSIALKEAVLVYKMTTLPLDNVAARQRVTTLLKTTAPHPFDKDSNNKQQKKEKKKYRKPLCSIPSCPNRVMNSGVCARHGARVRICSVPDCTKYAQKGGVCIRHGAKKEYKRCSVEGCNSRLSISRPTTLSGGGMNVCLRHASTCFSVGSIAAAAAAAAVVVDRGNDRQNDPQEEVRQDENVRIGIDEE